MKRHLLTLLLLITFTVLQAQINAGEDLNLEVSTINQVEYKEDFDGEGVVQIHYTLFDTEVMKLVAVMDQDSIAERFYFLLLSDSHSLASTTLVNESASVSPYVFMENSSIRLIDVEHLFSNNAVCCPPEGLTPTVAGILYEFFQHIKSGSFNTVMRIAESSVYPSGTKPIYLIRSRVQYNEYGGVYGAKIVVEIPKSIPAEVFDAGMDLVSFIPLAELGIAGKGIAAPFLAARTPGVTNLVKSVASKYDNFQCLECADAVRKALQKEGVGGQLIDIDIPSNLLPNNGGIWSDKANTIISQNGRHQSILVEGKVFDNIHPEGISYDNWLNDIHVPIGIEINDFIKINDF